LSPRIKETKGIVAIGVTGHRFLAEVDKIAAGVDEALRRIEEAFPGKLLAVISPLAEGADRRPGTQEPTILDEKQGKVSFERFPG